MADLMADAQDSSAVGKWLTAAGHAAGHIGQSDFHEQLLSVFASLVPNHASWIISYAPGVLPNVLHTADVASTAFTDYSNHFRTFDPFWHLWRRQTSQPVAALSTLDQSIKPYEYTSIFQKNCGFSDELAIILPIPSNTCVMLFLQQTERPFTQREINRARLVQPLLDGLHQSHIAQLFQTFSGSQSRTEDTDTKGLLVLDRPRNHLHSNRFWHQAELQSGHTLRRALRTLLRAPDGGVQVDERDFSLCLTDLPESCPLAPGGYLVTYTPQTKQPVFSELSGLHVTRREQELLELVLAGRSTGEIAQALGISKGTVKNHRQRRYRKAGVTSERGLRTRLQAMLQS